MNTAEQQIFDTGFLPLARLESAERAPELGRALLAAGVPCLELVGPAAGQALALLGVHCPGLGVGLGGVLSLDEAQRALDAGARFLSAPGFDAELAAWCAKRELPFFPGCATPSELSAAVAAGVGTVRLFPAKQLGGCEYLARMAAAFPGLRFLVAGGVTVENIGDYLSDRAVFAVSAPWLGEVEDCALLTRRAVETRRAALGFALHHIGVNTPDAAAMEQTLALFCRLFALEPLPGAQNAFAGALVEVMRPPCRGERGHIGFRANSLPRALAWLASQGVGVIAESAQYDPQGGLRLIYLALEIAGFAIHLHVR